MYRQKNTIPPMAAPVFAERKMKNLKSYKKRKRKETQKLQSVLNLLNNALVLNLKKERKYKLLEIRI